MQNKVHDGFFVKQALAKLCKKKDVKIESNPGFFITASDLADMIKTEVSLVKRRATFMFWVAYLLDKFKVGETEAAALFELPTLVDLDNPDIRELVKENFPEGHCSGAVSLNTAALHFVAAPYISSSFCRRRQRCWRL